MSRIRRAAVDDGQALPRKIAGILLCYPDQRVYGRLDDVDTALPAVADPAQREPLARAARWLSESGATAAARHHVEVFDFTRRCSPYLTYYRYGDTRQRGMALLALKHTYRRAGLEPTGDELPDYLPAVLEFAALAAGGGALLRTHRAGLELLRLALHDKDSPYAHVLDAVAAGLPTLTAKQAADVRRLAADGPPREEVGLDPVGTEPFAPPEYLYAGLTAGPPS